ncbi:glycosyltransferase family 1 protein [Streptomyces sp. NPDC004542]|uniref:glycosyltransferase family 4 protein n=1 Tax=Streptomyces sp. NPDC004542 TaxID=3154281 RepID=UPI0033A252AD
MRVLFSPDVFVTQRFGGVSRYFAELHTELVGLGVDARLFSGLHDNAHVRGGGTALGRLPVRPRLFLSSRTFRFYAAAQRAAHILHPTYYSAEPFGRRPHVCTFYDLIHHRYPDQFPNDTTAERQRLWARRADRIIAISHATARDLVSLLGVPDEKISVIHLGVRRPRHRTRRQPEAYVLYVGNRGGYKNWRIVVEALQDPGLKDLRLVCSGGGPVTGEEHALLERCRMAARVTFVTADDVTLSRCYREALGLVYPSLHEGFGLPPLEAMAQGVPVVAARAAAVEEVVGDAALLFDPRDVDDLVHTLRRLLDASVRQELEGRGPERARMFSWESTARQTADVYRSLLG